MFRRIQNKVTYFFINNTFIINTRLRFDLKHQNELKGKQTFKRKTCLVKKVIATKFIHYILTKVVLLPFLQENLALLFNDFSNLSPLQVSGKNSTTVVHKWQPFILKVVILYFYINKRTPFLPLHVFHPLFFHSYFYWLFCTSPLIAHFWGKSFHFPSKEERIPFS